MAGPEIDQAEIEDWLTTVLEVAATTVETQAQRLTADDSNHTVGRGLDDTARLLETERAAVETARRGNPLWPLRRPVGC
ncbi:MAG: hypothetical protein AAGC60_27485 [Acidobacteriota bacterium]